LRPSLYLHVPFCASRCAYCDFYSETAGDAGLYVEAMERHFALGAQDLAAPLPSVYVGGGTPSLLAMPQLARLLALPASLSDARTEFSVECNPEDVSEGLLATLQAAGVNRISLGVQSLADDELRRVGRRHDAAGARRALALAAGAPFRLSADLIIGLPGQTAVSFRDSVQGLLAFGPEHLSLYCLEAADAASRRREIPAVLASAPGEAFQAERYLEAHAMLAAAGYVAYELSNWCLPGAECRHNLDIWEGGEFLGFGPAAHSRRGGRRWSWPADLAAWQQPLLAGSLPEALEDRPDAQALELERLLLALRTRRGLAADDTALLAQASFCRACVDRDWARVEEGRWRLSAEGWLRLDAILARLAS
jgi:oxygen-independent coproporphyrinogen-3 oxidase